MKSVEVARLLGIDQFRVPPRAQRLGIAPSIGSGARHVWSPGDALAMLVMDALAQGKGTHTPSIYIEGALKCGEALDSGYPPAYLVTRGGTENVVVLESESPAQTDEMVAALLLSASDAGTAVRVVKLRPMVKALGPWLAELVDA